MNEHASGLRRVAIHEAGHAVVRYLYGSWNADHVRRFKTITVIPTDEYDGQVSEHSEKWMASPEGVIDLDYSDVASWKARTRRRVEHQIMVGLAGAVSEDLFGIEQTDATVPYETSDGQIIALYVGGASSDFKAVSDLATLIGGRDDTREAFVEWLHLRTRDFLDRPHVLQAVEALASALEEKGALGYRSSVAILDEAVLLR